MLMLFCPAYLTSIPISQYIDIVKQCPAFLYTNISETEHADMITFPSSFTNKGQSLRTLVSFLDMKSFCSSGISFWKDK